VEIDVDDLAEQRFWSKVDTSTDPDGCWLWTASRSRGGYGQFRLGTRMPPAHRVAYKLATGEQLGDRQAQETCRNRACVNPDHLRAVTHTQNAEHRLASRSNTSGALGALRLVLVLVVGRLGPLQLLANSAH
jgi:hypothetical protein